MARIIVMKFGGTSIEGDLLYKVRDRILEKKDEGYRVVSVVSAPGSMTDDLLKMAYEVASNPDPRELDVLLSTGEQVSSSLLSMSIKERGCDVISLTGMQAGIITDDVHNKARIKEINKVRIINLLNDGKIVIVAGFQGYSSGMNFTTLGRGGSDLSAVALAATLSCDCEIYTDVDGIYTSDPRVVKGTSKIDRISYDEILELSSLGAGVMYSRSIEVAKKYMVKVHVRSSLNNLPGTLIVEEDSSMEEVLVRGVTFDKDQVKVSIFNLSDEPGVVAGIFKTISDSDINIDIIVQSASSNGKNDLSFTINNGDLGKTLAILKQIIEKHDGASFDYDSKIGKLSIVGVGMRSHSAVASKMFEALAQIRVNIHMISTSEIRISCVIDEVAVDEAARALHLSFGLERGV